MTQQPGITATAVPMDITDGLAAGCFLAQVHGDRVDGTLVAVLYATRETAPDVSDPKAWFRAAAGESFMFRVGDGILPTWVVVDPVLLWAAPGSAVDVALARTGG